MFHIYSVFRFAKNIHFVIIISHTPAHNAVSLVVIRNFKAKILTNMELNKDVVEYFKM